MKKSAKKYLKSLPLIIQDNYRYIATFDVPPFNKMQHMHMKLTSIPYHPNLILRRKVDRQIAQLPFKQMIIPDKLVKKLVNEIPEDQLTFEQKEELNLIKLEEGILS